MSQTADGSNDHSAGTHRALLEHFYDAFAKRDSKTMAGCYHPEAEFSDPVFTDLRGERIGLMWRMLCEAGTDLEITYRDVEVEGDIGSVHWEASYTFSATGRKVHNVIEASFAFRDGLILEHHDEFDLWRWTRMALGLPGALFGWTSWLQGKVRRKAMKGLERFEASR